MSLSEVGVTGQRVDVLAGGDVDPSGRLLSVAEIQEAFRELRARTARTGDTQSQPGRALPAPAAPPMSSRPAPEDTAGPAVDPDATRTATTAPVEPERHTHDTGKRADALREDWIAVASAHAGAGASAVALAITDALTAAGQTAQLIETAHPTRSGLVAAAAAELGLDPGGAWRRGSRGPATIYRRAGETSPDGWPDPEPGCDATVVDLGLPALPSLARLTSDGPRLVVVFRVSIPGVRAAEHVLAAVNGYPTVLAAVGSKRWPGQVVHSLGPLLREQRTAGRVVAVEEDRDLQVTGLTHSELPRPLLASGGNVLRLLDPAQYRAANQSAHGAPWSRKKGTPR